MTESTADNINQGPSERQRCLALRSAEAQRQYNQHLQECAAAAPGAPQEAAYGRFVHSFMLVMFLKVLTRELLEPGRKREERGEEDGGAERAQKVSKGSSVASIIA
jgi:hypothetical protein